MFTPRRDSKSKFIQATESVSTPGDTLTFLPSTDRSCALHEELPSILEFIGHGKRPNGNTTEELDRLHRRAWNFFVYDNRPWRCDTQERHQLVLLDARQRMSVTHEAHDKLEHKGFYATLRTLLDRFWWPSLTHDIRW